jgi:hypothetical protein
VSRLVAIVRSRLVLPVALGLVIVAAGCTSAAASFDPSSACTTDGHFSRAYPELEALVPASLGGRAPDRLDSGRSCTEASLATLKQHAVDELRFAGGLWEQGSNSGTTLVVFEAGRPLDAAWLAEFYETGARAAKNTDAIESRPVSVAGTAGYRLDTLNDDSYQTVIVWPRKGHVVAALVASAVREVGTRAAHEARVTDALGAFDLP